MSPKCKDLDSFTVTIRISNSRLEKSMLELEASINFMPYNIYDSLNLGPLKEISIIVQLFDITNFYPKGVIEDFLV